MAATPGHASDSAVRSERSGSIEFMDSIYAATVAKTLVLLDQAKTAIIFTPVGNGEVNCISIAPSIVRAALSNHGMTEDMPSALCKKTHCLTIGSSAAIRHAGRVR